MLKRLKLLTVQIWNHKLKFVIGFLCLTLILSAVFRALTPPPPVKNTVVQESIIDVQAQTVTFEKIAIEMPSSLSAFNANNPQTDLQLIATNLAKQFGLIPVNNVDHHWQNVEGTESLFIEKTRSFITYQQLSSFEEVERSSSLPPILSSEAETIAENFILKHDLLSNYEILEPVAVQMSIEGFMETTKEEDENGYHILVAQKLDGLPLFVGSRPQYPVEFYINNLKKIVKANFYPTPRNFEVVAKYRSLSIDQIIQNAKNGDITYIERSTTLQNLVDSSKLTTINFSSATLEYRQNEENGFILPYVRFIGTGVDEEGNQYNVEAITPAIEVQ